MSERAKRTREVGEECEKRCLYVCEVSSVIARERKKKEKEIGREKKKDRE